MNRGARGAVLAPAERAQLLDVWSRGSVTVASGETVIDVIRRQTAASPAAPAVRYGDEVLTYGELDERAGALARRLRALGVGTETLIGVCLRRGLDLLPVLLGIWRAGAAYVPLDPDLPGRRLSRLLSGTGCPVVVSAGEHVPALAGVFGGTLMLLDDDEQATDPAGIPSGGPIHPDQLAYVIHTSGSTGTPKGVMVQHRGLLNYLQWTAQTYAADRPGGAPVFSSIGFDLGIPDLFTPLLTGQPVHLLPEPFEVADLGRLLAAGGPYSFIKLTPGHLDLLTRQLTAAQARDLAGLVIVAGDDFPRSLAERWHALAGPHGTGLATEYGPTEITVGNSGQPVGPDPRTPLIPLGAPIPNTTMYVLTGRLQPVPVGVPGEVYIGGAGVARGYLGRPDLTADRFLPDPYGPPGARLYRSGDLARWLPDGEIEFLGRDDHQVKIRGYRIELGEIRAALDQLPHVKDAVVLAHRVPGGATRLVAFVVAGPGRPVPPARLRAQLARVLPDHMIPSAVLDVSEIPLTRNGKVDAERLRGML